jgi:tRNA(Ile)-lysidine synthase
MSSGDIQAGEEPNPPFRRQARPADISFDDRFERLALSGRKCVVLAVSGGSDSTALLHFFTGFARRKHPSLKVIAVTVDHGLRAESAGEARQVAAMATALGVDHVTTRWTGDKPKAGLMEAAREARHRLLAEAAKEAGSDLVLVAHTLDDQAETVAMRGKRGGGRGEAGMAEATLYDGGVWFARPLLGIRRAALRTALAATGSGWIDDPSNEDARYERVRVRAALDDARIEALAAAAVEAAGDREALGHRAATLIDRYAALPVPGLIRVDPELLAERDREAAVYALRILLGVAGGQAHLPDRARAAALLERLAAGPHRATLSRAVADRRKAGLFLHRENRNLPPFESYQPGIWDGRYRLTGTGGEGLSIRAVGLDVPDTRPPVLSQDVPTSLARAADAAQPAMWSDGERLGLADGTRDITCSPAVAPWARYLPSFDLAPARAAARLVGAPAPPASPFAGHKERKA